MQALDLQHTAADTRDAAPVICDAPAGKPKRIEDLMREACGVRHYSRRTFQAYWHWSKRFILWSGKRHPKDMGPVEVSAYLTWLATEQQVSASTQRQALHGILFMYQAALGLDIGWIDGIVRAKQPQRLPTVLTVAETSAVLAATSGTPGIVLRLLYGAGLRLMEGLRLRVKDIDLKQRQVIVRGGKGDKDRVTVLPASLVQPLTDLLDERRRWHQLDLVQGRASVDLPNALARKYPRAGAEWAWQYVFATPGQHVNPETGELRRHHIFEWTIQRAMKDAVQAAGIDKPATPHTLRHCFATHLLQSRGAQRARGVSPVHAALRAPRARPDGQFLPQPLPLRGRGHLVVLTLAEGAGSTSIVSYGSQDSNALDAAAEHVGEHSGGAIGWRAAFDNGGACGGLTGCGGKGGNTLEQPASSSVSNGSVSAQALKLEVVRIVAFLLFGDPVLLLRTRGGLGLLRCLRSLGSIGAPCGLHLGQRGLRAAKSQGLHSDSSHQHCGAGPWQPAHAGDQTQRVHG